ncbi:Fructose-bisphosphate aldolase 1 [Mucor velutinosus]|uniref:Fructose-bisphosphate aldolase 1 n=1 Tax=Mucor velutinosus TaxID=708070 RepID=A0AAN7DCK5_9FUNG|nr:Fructose-bisphosphate aldolase 1 [Mucor velutinosus]
MDPLLAMPPSASTSTIKSNHHPHYEKSSTTTVIYDIPLPLITNNIYKPARATTERIPTTTWGSFTAIVVVFLVILTCFILNCSCIRRKVNEKRMDRLGRSGSLSFERRHKELQEADLEWNNHPPMVFTNEKLTTPESTYSSKHSTSSTSSSWSTANSTIAQKHHYQDKNFIKNQPPSVQLRLTLENASNSSLSEYKRPVIPLLQQQHFVPTPSNQS